MKTKNKTAIRHFQIHAMGYGNCYYTERIAKLEKALARQPRVLQLDLIGLGEIPADTALLIRSILRERSPATRLVTNARSSLDNASVLVWLQGDVRNIRADARLFFRRIDADKDETEGEDNWKHADNKNRDDSSEVDPEEHDYSRVMKCIDEYLPVKELAGHIIDTPTLRQFGLIESERADRFLAEAFGSAQETPHDTPEAQAEHRARDDDVTTQNQ